MSLSSCMGRVRLSMGHWGAVLMIAASTVMSSCAHAQPNQGAPADQTSYPYNDGKAFTGRGLIKAEIPREKSLASSGGYQRLKEQWELIAQAAKDGFYSKGMAPAAYSPANLDALVHQATRGEFDSSLRILDSMPQSLMTDSQTGQSYWARVDGLGRDVTLADVGTCKTAIDLIDTTTATLGKYTVAGQAVLRYAHTVATLNAAIADNRQTLLPENPDNQVDVEAHTRSRAAQAEFFRGVSSKYGRIPATTPVRLDILNTRNQTLLRQTDALMAVAMIPAELAEAPQSQMTPEAMDRLQQALAYTAGHQDFISPERALVRQALLTSYLQTLTPEQRKQNPALREVNDLADAAALGIVYINDDLLRGVERTDPIWGQTCQHTRKFSEVWHGEMKKYQNQLGPTSRHMGEQRPAGADRTLRDLETPPHNEGPGHR